MKHRTDLRFTCQDKKGAPGHCDLSLALFTCAPNGDALQSHDGDDHRDEAEDERDDHQCSTCLQKSYTDTGHTHEPKVYGRLTDLTINHSDRYVIAYLCIYFIYL